MRCSMADLKDPVLGELSRSRGQSPPESTGTRGLASPSAWIEWTPGSGGGGSLSLGRQKALEMDGGPGLSVDVLNPPELCTYQWLGRQILRIFRHNFLKANQENCKKKDGGILVLTERAVS